MTIMPINPDLLDSFVDGYAVATLWANTSGLCDCEDADDCPGHEYAGNPHDGLDAFTQSGQERIAADCAAFVLSNVVDLFEYARRRKYDPSDGDVWEHAGHDFALTRAGHGAGFWDRGLGALGDRLSDAARPWGDVNAWEQADGTVDLD